LLNETLFMSLAHVRDALAIWKDNYNTFRPHSALGNLPPAIYAKSSAPQMCSETAKLDRFWVEFSAVIPRLGGAESDEGLEVFGRPEGVYSQTGC